LESVLCEKIKSLQLNNNTNISARLCILQKGCTGLAAASDKAYQLLAHGLFFSPGSPASHTTKTGPKTPKIKKIKSIPLLMN
jgi:hypothetical protein